MGFTKRVPLLINFIQRIEYCLFFLFALAFLDISCNREMLDPDPDALPEFSTDTITFDTVFTTIGSTTMSFKAYNRSNRPLIISSVELAGGESSFFRLNIDGTPASRITRVEIPPDDSLFIFIAVTVDPTHVNNPVVINDSVVFITNGTVQDVKLIAYGQDVHLINGEIIGTQKWENDKPWLIYNSMAVDTGETLTIEAGTQVFFHRNSSLIVWGTILVEGTWENPVLFSNDRLEEFYRIVPGQWGTLYIDPVSTGNKIDHAFIRNAIAGIQIGYPADYRVPELELSNSHILNVSFAGIYAFGARVTCYNTVIANSAGPALALLRGGDYRFYHCTVSNSGVIGASRSTPSVILTNVFNSPELNESSGQYEYVRREDDLLRADFFNSIIYGNYEHEIQLVNNNSNLFNYHFDHSLLKAVQDSIDLLPEGNFTSVILNLDPAFVNDSDRYHTDYRLDTLSAAKDSGNPQLLIDFPFLQNDITGSLRSLDGLPDLGAFERKEE